MRRLDGNLLGKADRGIGGVPGDGSGSPPSRLVLGGFAPHRLAELILDFEHRPAGPVGSLRDKAADPAAYTQSTTGIGSARWPPAGSSCRCSPPALAPRWRPTSAPRAPRASRPGTGVRPRPPGARWGRRPSRRARHRWGGPSCTRSRMMHAARRPGHVVGATLAGRTAGILAAGRDRKSSKPWVGSRPAANLRRLLPRVREAETIGVVAVARLLSGGLQVSRVTEPGEPPAGASARPWGRPGSRWRLGGLRPMPGETMVSVPAPASIGMRAVRAVVRRRNSTPGRRAIDALRPRAGRQGWGGSGW